MEADFLLEFPQGLVALEVKAKATLGARDFVPLTRLRDRLGKRLLLAGILHPGERPLPFGEGVWALPLSYLWA